MLRREPRADDISSAPQSLVHEFFDELRVEGAKLPNGKDLPALFDFTKEGTSKSTTFHDQNKGVNGG